MFFIQYMILQNIIIDDPFLNFITNSINGDGIYKSMDFFLKIIKDSNKDKVKKEKLERFWKYLYRIPKKYRTYKQIYEKDYENDFIDNKIIENIDIRFKEINLLHDSLGIINI